MIGCTWSTTVGRQVARVKVTSMWMTQGLLGLLAERYSEHHTASTDFFP